MGKEIRTIYKEGQDRLAAGGIHDAAFDARALLSFVLGIPFREIPLHYVDEASDELQEDFDELIERRLKGEPLQYITGEQEFMGLTFHVDPRVLIPRLDTEILAEQAVEYVNECLNKMRQSDAETNANDCQSAEIAIPGMSGTADGCQNSMGAIRVLDLCCGSGAIGLSIAALANTVKDVVFADSGKDAALASTETNASQIGDEAVIATDAAQAGAVYTDAVRVEAAHIDAACVEVVLSDISADALDVARQNAKQLGVSDRVTFVESDLFDELEQGGFDLIVSNPPYIRSDVIPTLDVEVRGHEPMLALDGGADGLDVYRRIAEDAPRFLKPGGRIMLEIGSDQGEDVAALFGKEHLQDKDAEELSQPVFDDVIVMKDLAGLDRVVSARMK